MEDDGMVFRCLCCVVSFHCFIYDNEDPGFIVSSTIVEILVLFNPLRGELFMKKHEYVFLLHIILK